MKKTRLLGAVCACMFAFGFSNSASATTVFSQGFETDTSGWLDENDFAGFGTITRVASGTNGIASFEGVNHAVLTQTGPVGDESSPFTRFDGYRSAWPGKMTASAAVYLDLGWSAGEGFDYSVAANGSDGAHQRDFIFHVTKDTSTGKLLVGGSNNTNFNPREDLETINNYEVTTSGWYIFEQVFKDVGGILEVDLNLRDDLGSLLFTETRSNALDLIPLEVGGNRYGWFTNIDIAGGIEVDATSLTIVPIPAAVWLFGSGLLGLIGIARRKKT